jgi:hypothetical protein
VRISIAVSAVVLCLAGCGGGGGGGSSSTSSLPKMGPTTTTKGSSGVQLGPSFGSFAKLPGVQNTAPPWGPGNGPQLKARLLAMGLKPLSAEGTVIHIHQHLDIYVDGKKVTVPALIGISTAQQFISDLHTHDPTGIIHVESATASSFSLGQVFGVWGVPLSAGAIGSLKTGGGKVLKTWVNGKEISGDPTRIVVEAHQEIVVAYGTEAQMPKQVPASYAFPAGL